MRSSVRVRTAATSACCTLQRPGTSIAAVTESRGRREALMPFTTRVPRRISPVMGVSVPAIRRSSVVAPQAGGPAIDVCDLAGKVRVTPRTP
jgi:hypothetical protein